MLAASTFTAQSQLRVLIIDGFSNHDWKQTTAKTKQILEGSALFHVSVSTVPVQQNEVLEKWDPQFSNFDLVIQNTNNIHDRNLRWPSAIEKQLEAYVQAGGGLYILHSANNAFDHWKEYDKMIGLGWRAKESGFAVEIDKSRTVVKIPPGEGEKTYHGKRSDMIIQLLTRHPINRGFPRQWKTPMLELYKYARGPAENLTVLSYGYDSATQKNWPVDWVVQYGKGRVYNSSMGHLWKDDPDPVSYQCVGFQTTMIRAAEWLAKGKTTYRVPKNFPGKNKLSLTPASK